MGPAIGFGILFAILGLLWIGNSVADEMLEEKEEKKQTDDCVGCAL